MKQVNWMKKHFFALGLGLVIVTNLLASEPLRFLSSANPGKGDLKAADYVISGPYTHKNLTVFLIHGPDKLAGKNFLTLQEALDQKKVVVYETTNSPSRIFPTRTCTCSPATS
jgi:hypothetical protein